MGLRALPRLAGLSLSLCLLGAPALADDSLNAVLDGAHRDDAAKARDVYRHPKQTLAFFGIEPDMTVVEIWPGGGWYSDILAPYLKAKGTYIAADFGVEPVGPFAEFMQRSNQQLAEKLGDSAVYGDTTIAHLSPPKEVTLAPPETVDMVVTFRNLHNWQMWGGTGATLAGIFEALKPGGIFGVVDHRADPGAAVDPNAKNGYVNEQRAIELIEAAGFKLLARSELNANAADTKDYEYGVWTLPPVLRKGDDDRERYLAIGESDRFTLKFVKPE